MALRGPARSLQKAVRLDGASLREPRKHALHIAVPLTMCAVLTRTPARSRWKAQYAFAFIRRPAW